jgi:intracellular multiplication protein IcmK
MLTLIPGQKVVDYRVDVTVPGYGPSAKQLPISSGLPPEATPILLDVLDGIPPSGSKQLIVRDNVGSAWLLEDKIYIRTDYTLLSPGWLATMASADGTNAYELQRTPMVLMSKNGKVVHIKIEGF